MFATAVHDAAAGRPATWDLEWEVASTLSIGLPFGADGKIASLAYLESRDFGCGTEVNLANGEDVRLAFGACAAEEDRY